METPAGNSVRPGYGAERRLDDPVHAAVRVPVGSPRAAVLGSLTIPGRPEQVGLARAFVAQTFSSKQIQADCDAATLLTSEIVTNAIQHTRSGADGGTVTIVVIGVAHGVLIEIIDDGAAGSPVVKGDLYAAEGHGLFLVQHLATEWGYLKDSAGTTVWFHLPTAREPQQAAVEADPPADRDHHAAARHDGHARGTEPYQAQPAPLWTAAASSAVAPALRFSWATAGDPGGAPCLWLPWSRRSAKMDFMTEAARSHGTGPGVITPDGCAVDLYAQLPDFGEPAIVHAAAGPGASILELGCGTGRMTHPLVTLGHEVVAVDESPEMLAHVRDAETVCARIEGLSLGRRFDAVLLASHLINVADEPIRNALLAACREHVADGGCVIVQHHAPEWFAEVDEAERASGGMISRLRDVSRPAPNLVSATVEYVVGDQRWAQAFTAMRLDEAELAAALAAAGLRLDRYLTEDRSWFRAVPRS